MDSLSVQTNKSVKATFTLNNNRSFCNCTVTGSNLNLCICIRIGQLCWYCYRSTVLLWFCLLFSPDWHKCHMIREEFKTVVITLLSSVEQAKHLFCLKFFFPFFYWHNTFVQTSFKNINKLEPLRLTWQKTHYQMSWRRTNIFRKRFTNEMSLQNIKEKKLVVTQNITKNIYICLVSTFQL